MIISRKFLDALLLLHENLHNVDVDWAVGGDLGEALRTVDVEPDAIELVTSKEGSQRTFEALKPFNPLPPTIFERRLDRDAIVDGEKHPVYVRSHYFEFEINSVKVRVNGDLQYKVGSWDWSDPWEFDPEYVYVIGVKIAIVPIEIKALLYRAIGWDDRLLKIEQATPHPRIISGSSAPQKY